MGLNEVRSKTQRRKWVINKYISKRQLKTPEKSALKKCLNFATIIKRILYLDLIVPIDDEALKIPNARADELRWKARQALEKSKPPKPNISKTETGSQIATVL